MLITETLPRRGQPIIEDIIEELQENVTALQVLIAQFAGGDRAAVLAYHLLDNISYFYDAIRFADKGAVHALRADNEFLTQTRKELTYAISDLLDPKLNHPWHQKVQSRVTEIAQLDLRLIEARVKKQGKKFLTLNKAALLNLEELADLIYEQVFFDIE